MKLLQDKVIAALERVIDPCSASTGAPLSIQDMGMVMRLTVTGAGDVSIQLRPTSPMCTMIAGIMQAVEDVVREVIGVNQISVTVTSDSLWSEADLSPRARELLNSRRDRARAQLTIEPYEIRRRKAADSRLDRV